MSSWYRDHWCDVKWWWLSFLQKHMFWVKREPTCIEHILKLHLQNIKIPEIPIFRFYLYLLPNQNHSDPFSVYMRVFTECSLSSVLLTLFSQLLVQLPESLGGTPMEEVPFFFFSLFFLLSFGSSPSQAQHRGMGPQINFKIIMNYLHLAF